MAEKLGSTGYGPKCYVLSASAIVSRNGGSEIPRRRIARYKDMTDKLGSTFS